MYGPPKTDAEAAAERAWRENYYAQKTASEPVGGHKSDARETPWALKERLRAEALRGQK